MGKIVPTYDYDVTTRKVIVNAIPEGEIEIIWTSSGMAYFLQSSIKRGVSVLRIIKDQFSEMERYQWTDQELKAFLSQTQRSLELGWSALQMAHDIFDHDQGGVPRHCRDKIMDKVHLFEEAIAAFLIRFMDLPELGNDLDQSEAVRTVHQLLDDAMRTPAYEDARTTRT